MKYICPFDGAVFNKVTELEEYVEKNYKDKIPKYYKGDVVRFLFDLRNKPGRCQICGVKTEWDAKHKRYRQLCSVPESKDPWIITKYYLKRVYSFFKNKGNTCDTVMRKIYLENIKRVHNTDNLMGDPEYHKMLLENRKITSVVKYRGKDYTCVGSYEKVFVQKLDSSDMNISLQMPGPTINLEGVGNLTFSIPDAYIPEYNLIIYIKDMGMNPSYEKNYIKACNVFKYVHENTDYKVIELNGLEEVNNCVNIINMAAKDKLPIEKAMPVYMEKYEPDIYDYFMKKYKKS